MSPKPVIFLSAVSRELKSARQLVANTLTFLGYEPDWEDIFGAGEGNLLGELRRRIDASAGVVQIVGRCYGAEPPAPDDTFGRVSFTQYEALYARQRGRKVWYLFLDDGFPADPCDPEPEEIAELQRAYREGIQGGSDLYHPIKSNAELENTIFKLPNDLVELRHQMMESDKLQHQKLDHITRQNEALMEAVRLLSPTVSQQDQVAQQEDEATRMARTYNVLEEKLKLPSGTLAKELPRFAEQLLQRADTSALDRANAFFATRMFAEAEAQALQAKDQALAAAGKPVKDAIAALAVAGHSAFEQIHYQRALEHYRAAAALTSKERDPLEWAGVQWQIANVLYADGQYRETEIIDREINAIQQRVLGIEHPDSLWSRNGVGVAMGAQGKYSEEEQEHRAVLRIRERVLGPEHPDTLTSRSNLAEALRNQGRSADAEQEHRAVLMIRERVLGPKHPDSLASRNNLTIALSAQGKYAEAEREHRARIDIEKCVRGAEHPQTLKSRNNLGNALFAQGKYAEAENEHRAVLSIRRQVLGSEHPDTLMGQNSLANALDVQGKHSEAEHEHRVVLAARERVLGTEHLDVFQSCYNLAVALAQQNKLEDAQGFALRAEDGWRSVLGADHPRANEAKATREKIEAMLKH